MTGPNQNRREPPGYSTALPNTIEADNVEIISLTEPIEPMDDPYPASVNAPVSSAYPARKANSYMPSAWAAIIPGRSQTATAPENGRKKSARLNERIATRQLCLITRQLATLLQAGMPLVPALRALEEQLAGRSAAQIMAQTAHKVATGSSLAQSLRQWPDVFSTLYINMVEAGQASGTLEQVLEKLADTLEKRAELSAKIKSALAYPAIMAVTAVGVVVFLMTYVVPGLSQIFTEMDQALPWPTQMLIALSDFCRQYIWLLAMALISLIGGLRLAASTAKGRHILDTSLLRLPLIGPLILHSELSRMSRTLSVMLAGGIPIMDGLTIAQGIIQNTLLKNALETIKGDIKAGAAVADAFKATGLFPPLLHHTIAVGEMSGRLEQQLTHIADTTDNDIRHIVRSLTSLAEPLILLVMGLVVGFIVMAILLPIFEINQMI